MSKQNMETFYQCPIFSCKGKKLKYIPVPSTPVLTFEQEAEIMVDAGIWGDLTPASESNNCNNCALAEWDKEVNNTWDGILGDCNAPLPLSSVTNEDGDSKQRISQSYPNKYCPCYKSRQFTPAKEENRFIMIRDGCEYPIVCYDGNHYYIADRKRCNEPFEKCTGKHSDFGDLTPASEGMLLTDEEIGMYTVN